MPRLILLAALATIATASLTAPVTAQTASTVDVSAIDRALTAPATDARATLTRLFATEQGKAASSTLGLSPDAVAARVAILDDAGAERLADRVLAGGRGNVVISTTAIIIILLVLILITD
ncbi:MAG TPA: hypothetical protein VFN22_09880 [Gemmatimonadales bacterium]|nr:hypothetical protein [Gemmatimonadales bacterium]